MFSIPCEPSKYIWFWFYYMQIVDDHMCLLSTCNLEFVKLFAQGNWLSAQFSYYSIKIICHEKVGDYAS